jgi:4-hydroxybenzoate polyprenyltransferase
LLELGRVSNLPTVLSNVLCGAALTGESQKPLPLALAVVAGALFYTGGMFLNDAFDATIDAVERPERPIVSGRASRDVVLAIGFGMLAAGVALLGLGAVFAPAGPALPLAGLVTAALVVVYDRWHKGLAWSPVVMGACRASLYVVGALAVATRIGENVAVPALCLLAYVVGLTHVARFENASTVGRAWPLVLVFLPLVVALSSPAARVAGGLPLFALTAVSLAWSVRAVGFARRGGRQIGRAVVTLIAGISLLDAVFAASRNALPLAGLAVACFALTLAGQRAVRGT